LARLGRFGVAFIARNASPRQELVRGGKDASTFGHLCNWFGVVRLQHVPELPLPATALTVQAGALDASQCIGEGPGLRACVLGETADFSITPRDANGYVRRMARGAPFRVCCINGAAHIEFAVEARVDGSYGIRYTPCGRKGEQLLILAVTFAGKPIRGSPFRVAVLETASIAYALETALTGGALPPLGAHGKLDSAAASMDSAGEPLELESTSVERSKIGYARASMSRVRLAAGGSQVVE
jgi:hypothetical protein